MSANDRTSSFAAVAMGLLISAHSGYADLAPEALLASWKFFVKSCEEGYTFNEAEFDNDRRVRNAIAILLGDDELKAYPEWEPWAREIADLDARYRAIVIPIPRHSGPWWMSSVPKWAGHELVDDVLRIYGLHVEER
jgi:hypothetical protein